MQYIDEDVASIQQFAQLLLPKLKTLGLTLYLEPGRSIVANAGVLLTRVDILKPTEHKNFAIVDAAMNDLIRPTLYEAYHEIQPVESSRREGGRMTADIVGPVCETGDYLAKERELPEVFDGDLLAVHSAGAYGAVQSGTYNSRLLVPEVLVKEDQFAVVRDRPSYDELINLDKLPHWLSEK